MKIAVKVGGDQPFYFTCCRGVRDIQGIVVCWLFSGVGRVMDMLIPRERTSTEQAKSELNKTLQLLSG